MKNAERNRKCSKACKRREGWSQIHVQISKVQIFPPFLFALTRCLYSPLPPLVFTLMTGFKQWNRAKRRQMWLCGKLLCHSDVYGNHIFSCSLWEGGLFFQHFEKDLRFHLDLCTIAFLSVLYLSLRAFWLSCFPPGMYKVYSHLQWDKRLLNTKASAEGLLQLLSIPI